MSPLPFIFNGGNEHRIAISIYSLCTIVVQYSGSIAVMKYIFILTIYLINTLIKALLNQVHTAGIEFIIISMYLEILAFHAEVSQKCN